ncbi:MAG: hypothetical protein QNK56_04140 [Pontimonas sp.]
MGESPSSLSADVIINIRTVEESLSVEEAATLRWTLTWLENRPIATLDNGEVVQG